MRWPMRWLTIWQNMVGGSGLRTVPEDRAAHPQHIPTIALILIASSAVTGCVYFNALYNANRLYDQGVREIEEGREGSGYSTLGMAIEKAERIAVSKPNSRWADDAVRLVARSRLLREEWEEAADASGRLLEYATSHEDSAEAAGYLGVARVNLGDPLAADSLLSLAIDVEEAPRQRAELLAYRGRARTELGDYDAADEDLQLVTTLMPTWVPPRIDYVRLLTDNGRGDKAAVEFGTLLTLAFTAREERQVVDLAVYVAESDPAAAVKGLQAIEGSTLIPNNQAELLKLRADLETSLGNVQDGRGDYRLTVAVAPESRAAAEAQLNLVMMELQTISTEEEFDSLLLIMDATLARPGGRRSPEVRDLQEVFVRVDYWLSVGNIGLMSAGETLRDRLQAPLLARRVFLRYADEQSQSVWAPKAILAALYLTPLDSGLPATEQPGAEQLRQRLTDNYLDSPYVQALVGGGESRYSYEELELGLRRQLERMDSLADQEVRNRRSGQTQNSNG